MSSIRRVARRVLHFVVRLAPPGARSWGEAMIGEIDHIDDDWAALRWALGSTIALSRCSLIEHLRNLRNLPADEVSAQRKPTHLIKSILSGVGVAIVVLIISTLTLATLQRTSWVEPSQARFAQLLFAVVIPDALCLLAALELSPPQRRLASGILAAGVALGAHSIIFFVA
jgi:hypothetical protein